MIRKEARLIKNDQEHDTKILPFGGINEPKKESKTRAVNVTAFRYDRSISIFGLKRYEIQITDDSSEVSQGKSVRAINGYVAARKAWRKIKKGERNG